MNNQVVYDFTGASVLVTGGTSGIGHAAARQFAAAGAAVVVTGRKASRSDYDTDLSGLQFHPCQMSEPSSIDALLGVLGALDVLVSNAGATSPGGDEMSPDGFAASVQLNLFSHQRLIVGCHERLKASPLPGGASVVSTLSMSAHRAAPRATGYGSSKSGLLALTYNLASSWASDGIRVNAISPGLIVTPMTAGIDRHPAVRNKELQHTPLGRFGTAEECADVIVWLSSYGARYVTGTALAVDGGYLSY
jgi:NAD(P)-dependent dehydrogenase (short-subunit alcohol dehydrogenase family)